MDHLEPALKDRYARHAKAYTEHTLLLKRRAADRRVRKYTAMAAATALILLSVWMLLLTRVSSRKCIRESGRILA